MECVLFVGLPAAGKSTFYRERFATTHVWISKDRMGHARRPQRHQERLLEEALERGQSVVIDNTNPTAAVRAPIVALGQRFGAHVVAYYFPTIAADALRRNRAREGRERVPDVAIFAVRKQLEPPMYSEGFDGVFIVTIDEPHRTFDVHPMPRG